MNITELDAAVAQYLPDQFLERVLRAIFTAHSVSFESVREEFADSEAVNLLPYYRRAKFEGYLRDAAERSGIEAKAVRSEGSNWNHTEVRSGPVLMTASSVQVPCGLVDPSDFRLSLAQPNPGYLWEEPTDVLPEGTPLYVLLLHSRSQWETESDRRKFGMLPGSAHLAFPTRGLDSYLHSVDLFAEFPAVVESFLPQDWDADVTLRYLHNARRSHVA